MNQLSQSVRDPPASVAVKARFSDGISQRCVARPFSNGDAKGLEQVLRRLVFAMRVLHALEDRELAPRPHVDLEQADAVDDVIVDALGVGAVALAARLPVAFENIAGVVGKRPEQLGRRGMFAEQRRRRAHPDEKPGSPGEPLTHGAPFA